MGVYQHNITTYNILTIQNIWVKGILNDHQYSSSKSKNTPFCLVTSPWKSVYSFWICCKYISGEGKCVLSGVCHCLPSSLVYKILQWLHPHWNFLSASFQFWSPRIRSASVGQSLEHHLASVFCGQILPCRVVSEFMVITLWRQLSAGFTFPNAVPHHKIDCQDSFTQGDSVFFCLSHFSRQEREAVVMLHALGHIA